jgi:NAD(P)-dependent dehydrogenase (short-subunit alcohol dehydrogenase family)
MSEFRWAGRVALVTGGNSGIGAAITRRLLELGLIVVALDRNIDSLQVCKICGSTAATSGGSSEM